MPIVKAAKNGKKGKGKGKAKSKSKPAPKDPKPPVDEVKRAERLAIAKTIREVKRAAELVNLNHAREKPRRGHRPHGEVSDILCSLLRIIFADCPLGSETVQRVASTAERGLETRASACVAGSDQKQYQCGDAYSRL